MRLAKSLALLILTVPFALAAASAQPVITPPVPGPGKNFVFLFHSGGGFPPLPPVIIPPIMMGLQAAHLTPDQRAQVDQILQSNRARVAPLADQLRSVHEQIANKLLGPGAVSESDLAPLENQAAQLDAQIQQQALNASIRIRALLTPEQVTRMAQFHQKMAALQAQMQALTNEGSQQPSPEPTP